MTDRGLYIGLMSGTSMDALDAVLVRFDDSRPVLTSTYSCPIPDGLRHRLSDVCHSRRDHLDECARLDSDFGRFEAMVVETLLKNSNTGAENVQAIGSHGQTVRHVPDGDPPYSIQVGDPALLAVMTGIDVVADFRRQDIAAGGQGAPLVPAFHAAFWRKPCEDRVLLNLGGISNITILPGNPNQPVTGLDCGPANALLDAWIRKNLGLDLDEDGKWAANGRIVERLLEHMLSDPYFARPLPKSTGTEYFNLNWLMTQLEASASTDAHPADIQATLCALTVESVTRAIQLFAPDTRNVYVCGGGALNGHLIEALRVRMDPIKLEATSVLGLDPQWVEATAFAWLARENLHGRPGNLPSVTGAQQALVLGGLYRGRIKSTKT